MASVLPWIILILILLGNMAFWLHLFNRINATGLPRKQIKLIEKLVVVGCFLLPGLTLWHDQRWLAHWLNGAYPVSALRSLIHEASWTTIFFGIGSLAALLWLAPSWLIARFRLHRPPKALLHTTVERNDLRRDGSDDIYSKRWVKSVGTLPGNQLHLLDVTTHEVCISRLSSVHDGLHIGHLSDVHLTGYMHFRFYREAVERLMSRAPDIFILSGDLIDYEACLGQVEPLLEGVQARLGRYFVLGNHDRRLKNVAALRAMLVEMGWHDLGARSRTIEYGGEELFFVGSERPWFENPARNLHELESSAERIRASLRIGVSHSPDQIRWARELELDLLFCGHTHGGQVRIPWIGPIVAPSRFGSRYASGWFDCTPTLMHVSRGLSGTHPLRLGCSPEVSSIILREPKLERGQEL